VAGERVRVAPALVLAADVVAFFLLIRALVPARAVVGSDGVTVERILSRTFVPYEQLASMTREPGAIVLALRGSKRRVRLPTGNRSGISRSREDLSPQAVLYNRLCEAMAANKLGSSERARVGELDRAGRTLAAWRDHLRALTRDESSYRRAALSRDELTLVLEDAGAPAERRVAAALALATVAEPGHEQRIHDAVVACADEPLRIALEAAAEDELTEEQLAAVSRRRAPLTSR
jgi:hypothetical protein